VELECKRTLQEKQCEELKEHEQALRVREETFHKQQQEEAGRLQKKEEDLTVRAEFLEQEKTKLGELFTKQQDELEKREAQASQDYYVAPSGTFMKKKRKTKEHDNQIHDEDDSTHNVEGGNP